MISCILYKSLYHMFGHLTYCLLHLILNMADGV